MLENQVPWAVAFAYYPKVGIIFETLKLQHKKLWRQQKRALTINTNVNLTQAYGLWRDGEEYKARKRVFFVLQMTLFATQLLVRETIFDWWHEPNSLRKILFDPNLDNWIAFERVYRPIYDFIVERYISLRCSFLLFEYELLSSFHNRSPPSHDKILQQIVDIYERKLDLNSKLSPGPYERENKSRLKTNDPPSPIHRLFPGYFHLGLPLTTLYIRMRGISSLERDMAMNTTRHKIWPNLIHFSRTPTLTPVDSIVAAECHGLIVDELNGYLPVAWSRHAVYRPTDDGPVRFDAFDPLTPLVVLPHLDGTLVFLFWYEGEWRLSTVASIDGSETLCFCSSSSQEASSSSTYSCSKDHSIANLFWDTWKKSGAKTEKMERDFCYSFWFLHPLARRYVLYEEPKIVIEGCIRWNSEIDGCIDVEAEKLKTIFPYFSLRQNENESGRFGATIADVLDTSANENDSSGDKSSNAGGSHTEGKEKAAKKKSASRQATSSSSGSSVKYFGITSMESSKNGMIGLGEEALELEIGGKELRAGFHRLAPCLYIPCAFMTRVERIRELEGDYQAQELEVLHMLVEQTEREKSAFLFPPLANAHLSFSLVIPPLKSLLAVLDSYIPRIKTMPKEEVRAEAAKLGEIGNFLFFLRSSPPFSSAALFLKHADRRRTHKYLHAWWTRLHSKAPPRTDKQFSYK